MAEEVGSSSNHRVDSSILSSSCPLVKASHDTEPQIAPNSQTSTLHGNSLPPVCECFCVNERQKSALDKSTTEMQPFTMAVSLCGYLLN